MHRCLIFLSSFATISLLVAGCGEPEVATSPAMDAIEQELETARHAQLLAHVSGAVEPTNAFETDGCSGGLSLAWKQLSDRYPEFEKSHGGIPPWEDCCVAHDRQYHVGGGSAESATESFEQRRDADLSLRACVIEVGIERSGSLQRLYGLSEEQIKSLYTTIADLMYRAVRLGGIPCTSQPWRWGFGWPECGFPDQGSP